MPLLKIKGHDEEKEREFELMHQMSLTTQQRFEAMISLSIELIKLAIRHGYRKTPKIVKRT